MKEHVDLTTQTDLPVDLRQMVRRIRPDQLSGELLVKAARFHRRVNRSSGAMAAGGPTGDTAAGPCRGGHRDPALNSGTAEREAPGEEPGEEFLWAVDATAGLGQDSMLLAAAGYRVDLCEKNPETAQLLEQILRQAAEMPELQALAGRLYLHEMDSVAYLQSLTAEGRTPDLVYLDPMFPARHKSSKVKKKLQLLQAVEAPCDDAGAEALLEAAVNAGPRRIVIKRPVHGPYLAGRKPSYSIRGKVIRYDCLVLRT